LELARMGLAPSARVAEESFSSEDARVWFIGGALHSDLTPQMAGGALYSFVLLGLAQEVGMPLPRGGASSLAGALRACIEDRGGRVLTDQPVQRLVVREGRIMGVETPSGLVAARRAVLATIEPQQLFLRLMDEGALPSGFVRAVRRFHWGSGVFKLDCALSGLPTFASERLNGVSVLHLGRSTSELTLAAAATEAGLLPAHPPLIVGIHTLADPTRAPQGAHTLWIETHVPARIRADAAGSIVARDWALAREAFAERLLDELEAYAPGLRSLLLGTRALSPDDLQALDANLVGGDNVGGTFGLHQQAVLRPVPGWFQHRTPIHGLYLGGASTHPGGGVHGAPGSNAARVLLADLGRARRYHQAFRA
jgi:phytoene dehydrogenase-like protein